jgi:hypothetical protein
MTNSNQILSKDICTKWTKVTVAEADAVKTPESLSAQLIKSYNLPKAQAEADVKAWLAGRTF